MWTSWRTPYGTFEQKIALSGSRIATGEEAGGSTSCSVSPPPGSAGVTVRRYRPWGEAGEAGGADMVSRQYKPPNWAWGLLRRVWRGAC